MGFRIIKGCGAAVCCCGDLVFGSPFRSLVKVGVSVRYNIIVKSSDVLLQYDMHDIVFSV